MCRSRPLARMGRRLTGSPPPSPEGAEVLPPGWERSKVDGAMGSPEPQGTLGTASWGHRAGLRGRWGRGYGSRRSRV